MPSYVAFLRAINLGAVRKFPKADIVAAVESVGATDVATHINTGNVRLTSRRRSRDAVEAELEAAFAADRGFVVPTVVFTVDEVATLAAEADRLAERHGGPHRHYLTLLKQQPTDAMLGELEALSFPGEHAEVSGRAIHIVLTEAAYHSAKLSNARIEKVFGVATTRDVKVVRAIAAKWC